MSTIYLTYGGELRQHETGDPAIQTLTRKGWQETTPPAYDASKQKLSWDGDWVVSDLSAEEIAAAARKVWGSSAAFWSEFADEEKIGIVTSTIPGIMLLREELRLWTGEVWSDDPRVQQGLAGLVAAGIITESRKKAILAK